MLNAPRRLSPYTWTGFLKSRPPRPHFSYNSWTRGGRATGGHASEPARDGSSQETEVAAPLRAMHEVFGFGGRRCARHSPPSASTAGACHWPGDAALYTRRRAGCSLSLSLSLSLPSLPHSSLALFPFFLSLRQTRSHASELDRPRSVARAPDAPNN